MAESPHYTMSPSKADELLVGGIKFEYDLGCYNYQRYY